MTLTITIEMENQAFYEPINDWNPAPEVLHIVTDMVNRWQRDGAASNATLYDSNGGKVGHAIITE